MYTIVKDARSICRRLCPTEMTGDQTVRSAEARLKGQTGAGER